jgi:hypothetical protein
MTIERLELVSSRVRTYGVLLVVAAIAIALGISAMHVAAATLAHVGVVLR